MRAAFFEAARTIVVRETPVPVPGPGDVRLRVRFTGICGSDLSLYKTGALAGPGVVLGHEVSAEVDLDPSGRLAAGARVTAFPPRGCGRCVWCRAGHPRHCLDPPAPRTGAFAEYTLHPGEHLIEVPEDLGDRAVALAEPLGVALRGVALASPRPGDLAFVSGLGPIGLLTVAGLVSAGCRVIATDPRRDRRELAGQLGCEEVFDPADGEVSRRALAYEARGPRCAFECAGVPASLQSTFDACGPLGIVGVLGIPTAPTLLLRMTLREQRAFSIAGPSMGSMHDALSLLAARPGLTSVVTRVVPLAETGDAMEALVAGDGGVKVLVAPRE